ncbi:hypothetical protein, partial [Rhodopirellula bahusiensis]|uniref:hypothetical protein n=1 Tax=Rhodopirellula bahusiensis TaxID=2014065 RepID=UPI003266D644
HQMGSAERLSDGEHRNKSRLEWAFVTDQEAGQITSNCMSSPPAVKPGCVVETGASTAANLPKPFD